MKSYSTETALKHIIDTLYKSVDSSHCSQLLLLSSEFDTLTIFIERINDLGIEGFPLRLLL